jgi:protein translocase SecG subunit
MNILYILDIVISVLLIGSILLQSQGGGLSPVFGGGGEMYRSKQTIEKLLIIATSVLTVLLVIISIALLSLS